MEEPGSQDVGVYTSSSIPPWMKAYFVGTWSSGSLEGQRRIQQGIPTEIRPSVTRPVMRYDRGNAVAGEQATIVSAVIMIIEVDRIVQIGKSTGACE